MKKKTTNHFLARRIKELRESSGYTRQQFIDKLQLTKSDSNDELLDPNYYRVFEYGTRSVPDYIQEKISEYYGIPVAALNGQDVEQDELRAELNADYDVWHFLRILESYGYKLVGVSENLTATFNKTGVSYKLTYDELTHLSYNLIDDTMMRFREP